MRTSPWPRRLLWLALLLLLLLFGLAAVLPRLVEQGQNRVLAVEPAAVDAASRELHARLRIADWHADSLLWDRDLRQRADYGHVDLPRLREAGVTLQVYTAVTQSPAGQNYERNTLEGDRIRLLALAQRWPRATWDSPLERALHQARRLQGWIDAGAAVRLLRDAPALRAALAERGTPGGEPGGEAPAPLLAVLGIEGMHALEGELAALEALWAAGYRIFGLQHFFDNRLGGSLHGQQQGGLSDFGREVVQAIEARGGIVDVAHSSAAVVEDVLALARRPVVVSHTGVAGACDSPRNLPDALMARIAAAGGLIAIGYWDAAVCEASAAGIVASLRYAIDTFGLEHVALGSDFDGAVATPFDVTGLPQLTATMRAQGFSEAEIAAVMGENTLRFLQRWLPQSPAATPAAQADNQPLAARF